MKKNLSVLYIVGGTEKTRIILNALKARYFRVMVLSGLHSCVNFCLIENDGINKYGTLLSFSKTKGFARYLNLVRAWFAIFCLIFIKLRHVQFHLCIAEGVVAASASIVLKKLRRVEKNVYYAQDWFPCQGAFQALDKLCELFSDATWNYTRKIVDARHQRWKVKKSRQKVEEVIPPLYGPEKINYSKKDFKESHVCYLGGIRKDVGLEMVIKAISSLKREGVQIILEIIGIPLYPDIVSDLKTLASRLGVSQQINIYGYVEPSVMHDILRRCVCGLALFPGGDRNYSNYSIPGKVREYLEHGVPVILTGGSVMEKELEDSKAGLIIDFSLDGLSRALYLLSTDVDARESYSKNAVRYARRYASPKHLYQAIERLIFNEERV